MKKFLIVSMALLPLMSMAQEVSLASQPDPNRGIMTALIVVLAIAAVGLTLVAVSLGLRARILREETLDLTQYEGGRISSWWNLFVRKNSSVDQAMEGHEYDGIKEYDNNPPAWFNWLFYGTIAYAIWYLSWYHVFKVGPLQEEEYIAQVEAAKPIIAAAQEKGIKLADLPPNKDAAVLTKGEQLYTKNCVACHGAQGEGLVGPNLTDEYWLHGGSYKDIFTVIFEGVPEKGMISWKKTLLPHEIQAIASYVNTLRGTKPSNPKDPQGEKYTDNNAVSFNNEH